jgi:hypothetical protein
MTSVRSIRLANGLLPRHCADPPFSPRIAP